STSVLREYNPQILRDRVPPTGGDYLISLPADRIAHALATFPAYLDQETVDQNDAEEDMGSPAPSIAAGDDLDPADIDDPPPRGPTSLGKNRLPAYTLPGDEGPRMSRASLVGIDLLATKLPAVLVGAGVGWQRPAHDDPLGILRGRVPFAAAAKA